MIMIITIPARSETYYVSQLGRFGGLIDQFFFSFSHAERPSLASVRNTQCGQLSREGLSALFSLSLSLADLIIFVVCRKFAFVSAERGRREAITRAGRASVRIRGFSDKAARRRRR